MSALLPLGSTCRAIESSLFVGSELENVEQHLVAIPSHEKALILAGSFACVQMFTPVQNQKYSRLIELDFEIVNPEFVGIAQHHVAWPAGNQANPIIERLPVVAVEIGPAFFHFDQHDRFPDQIGKGRAAFFGLFDCAFPVPAGFFEAFVPKRLKEAVQEDLRFPFFVAADVRNAPRGESGEQALAGIVHDCYGDELNQPADGGQSNRPIRPF